MDMGRGGVGASNFAAKTEDMEKNDRQMENDHRTMGGERAWQSVIGVERDERLLGRALECWEALRTFREERERCKRFTYGDQWNDLIEDCGVRMREEDFIRSQGNIPLKNNLIRRLVRNVLGVFRNQWVMPRCVARDPAERREAATVNALLDYNMEQNRLEEIYARTMEEFLISGMVIHKKWYGLREGRSDCRTDHISPGRFFVDSSSRDIRGIDVGIIGEIHDMEFEELCATFARTPEDVENLGRIYSVPGDDHRAICRVFEVWERRRPMRLSCHDTARGRRFRADMSQRGQIERENRRRAGQGRPQIKVTALFDDEWRYAFLTPDGTVLARGVSPYAHGRHPYVFKAYPYIDGEIHSFVSDIIDQQKLTNRLISMYDWILRASAKGVLLFPEGSLPDGVDINDIADEWGRFNGVIVYRPRAGVPLPQQVSSKSTDIGITQLLEIQMKMMEDISGVNGALQGKLDSSTMSGTLYNQQTRNSLTALADLLKSFDDFMLQATAVDASNIRQYYSPRRIEAIIGRRPGMTSSLKPRRDFFHTPYDFSCMPGDGKSGEEESPAADKSDGDSTKERT